jgi:hypothetical protein
VRSIVAAEPQSLRAEGLLTQWLDAAKREKLVERHPDYVKALERAMVVLTKAPSPQHAIETLQLR